jgi:hypothetical protein
MVSWTGRSLEPPDETLTSKVQSEEARYPLRWTAQMNCMTDSFLSKGDFGCMQRSSIEAQFISQGWFFFGGD